MIRTANPYRFAAFFAASGMIVECDNMRSIWWDIRHCFFDFDNRSVEIYDGDTHVSTLAEHDGRVYYRRTNSLRLVDVTHLIKGA